jgi:hypothetical protein
MKSEAKKGRGSFLGNGYQTRFSWSGEVLVKGSSVNRNAA